MGTRNSESPWTFRIFFFVLFRGGGKGGGVQGGDWGGGLKNIEGGGVRGGGAGGGRALGECLWGKGGVNILFVGRNAHQGIQQRCFQV